jgi:hypothetical protein
MYCRGISNDATIQALKGLIQKRKPSMFFLWETNIHNSDVHTIAFADS